MRKQCVLRTMAMVRRFSRVCKTTMRDATELPGHRSGRAERALFAALDGDYRLALLTVEPFCADGPIAESYNDAVRALRASRRGDSRLARSDFERACAAFEASGRFDLAAAVLDFVARFALLRGDFDEALAAAQRERCLAQQWELPAFLSRARHTIFRVGSATGEIESIEGCGGLERAAAFLARSGSAEAQQLLGRHDAAMLFELCLRSVTDVLDAADLLADIAAFGQHQHAHEATMLLEAQSTYHEFRLVSALALLARSHVAANEGDVARATSRAAEAARRLHEIGARTFYERAMSVLTSAASPDRPGRRDHNGLTRRQRQIVSLLRSGASNREIARLLHITEHTVESHVAAVLDQLGVHSRWQLVNTQRD